jgi:hypothetical protein
VWKAVLFIVKVSYCRSKLELHSEMAGSPYIRLRSEKKQNKLMNISTTDNTAGQRFVDSGELRTIDNIYQGFSIIIHIDEYLKSQSLTFKL